MEHTIQLTAKSEQRLKDLSKVYGVTIDEMLTSISESVAGGSMSIDAHDDSADLIVTMGGKKLVIEVKMATAESRLSSRPSVMGGDLCIRDTRVPVWLLVAYKNSRQTNEQILANYPGLTQSDLDVAWQYYDKYPAEIEEQMKSHAEAV